MELDEAFEFAVVLAWEDLAKVSKPRAVRIEYLCEPGTAVDYLSVWSVRAGGEQDLVCDYRTRTSSAYPSGVRFRNGHCSEQLDRKSTRLNSSHRCISYAVFCLKKKKNNKIA